MPGGFAGGFAEGFSSSFGARQKANQFAAQMGFQQQELDLRQKQFEEQKSEFGTDVQLRQRGLDLQEAQQKAIKEHNDFADKLNKTKADLELRQHDLEVVKQFLPALDKSSTPQMRSAVAKLFAASQGIDVKDPQYKLFDDVLKALPDDDLENAKQLMIQMLPGAAPGSITAAAKGFIQNPAQMLNVITELTKARTADKNPIPVADPTSPTGERYMTPEQATGQPSPGGTQRKTAAEIKSEADIALFAAQDKKYLEETLASVNAQKALKPYADAFETAMKSDKFVTGTAAGGRLLVSRALEFFGVDVNKDYPELKGLGAGTPATAELMQAMSARMGLEFADKMSRLTNLSLSYIQEAMPNLIRTKEGNQLIIDVMRRADHRASQIQDLYEEFRAKGSLNPPGERTFQQRISDLDRVDPVIDKTMEDSIKNVSSSSAGVNAPAIATGAEGAAAGAAAAAGARILDFGNGIKFPAMGVQNGLNIVDTNQGKLPVIWDDADLEKLKAGDKFIYKDGKAYTWSGKTP